MVIDVTPFIGQVREVFEPQSGRTVTVTVGDGGPLKWWDHRPVITLRVDFHDDGTRSHVATADAAASIVAAELFAGYTTGVLGGQGWDVKVDREYRGAGPKTGQT